MLPFAFAATDLPNLLFAAPSDAVSLAAVDVADDVVAHPVDGFMNTYAAPFESTPSAPTTTVPPSPLVVTLSPKLSVPAEFALVSVANGVELDHPVAGFVYTYTFSPLVPTTSVFPFVLIDTECPKYWLLASFLSLVAPSDWVVPSVHPPPGFPNTYAVPMVLLPPGLFPGDPMTTVFPSPLTETEFPKKSSRFKFCIRIVACAAVPLPHPPDGFVNTYAAPWFIEVKLPRFGAPTTIVLPSLLTPTDFPKPCPADPAILTPVGVVPSPHPPDGLVNTYTPGFGLLGAPTTIVLSSALTAVEIPNAPAVLDRETFSLWMIGGPNEFAHEPEPAPPEDDAQKTPPSPSVAKPATNAAIPRTPSATTDRKRMNISSPPPLTF